MDIKSSSYTLSTASAQASSQGHSLEAVAQQREAADTFTERKEAARADTHQDTTERKSSLASGVGENLDFLA